MPNIDLHRYPTLHMTDFTIQPVNQYEKALERIYALWRKHSTTLDFFPKGAFSEYIHKNQNLK